MKKLLRVILLLLILSMYVLPEGINVLRPNSRDEWYTGTTKNISWSWIQDVTGKVKIRLFNQSDVKILDIVNETGNTGFFNTWEIPRSVREGMYKIRVKTVDNRYFGDSALFKIKVRKKAFPLNHNTGKVKLPASVKGPNPEVLLPDFYIKEISYSTRNEVLVVIINKGRTYSGNLMVWYEINGVSDVVVKNVLYKKGKENYFGLGRILVRADCDENQRVEIAAKVDWNRYKGVISESDEDNNYKLQQRFAWLFE